MEFRGDQAAYFDYGDYLVACRTIGFLKSCLVACLLFTVAASTACGGGAGASTPTSDPPPTTYLIGGTVSGLAGSGLVLQDNSSDNLPVSADGSFTFTSAVASGNAYSVSVLTQPSNPSQNCTVANGSGTATANVTTVQVNCATTATPMYTIGGTVSGLSGTGLVLQDNNGDNLAITGNGNFTFATQISSGSTYSVTVLTQPSSQNCVVTNGSGMATANVTTVQVTCTTIVTATYTIGGTISGLSGTGLVLQDNGGDNLAITGNGNFTFATQIAAGSSYLVTVLTEPS